MRFLLDTDICIYALKQHRTVLDHLLSRSRSDIAISVITEAELRTGAAKSEAPVKTLRLIENFLALKRRLEGEGWSFSSDTDTEIVAHLVDEQMKNGVKKLYDAVRGALPAAALFPVCL